MRNLIKAEYFKLVKSMGFKLLFLGNILSTIIYIVLLVLGSKATGYQVMLNASTDVLHYNFLGYLFAAIFICGEFSNQTFSMSLLCGHSRLKVFLSKLVIFICGVLLFFFVYVGFSTTYASIANGFGVKIGLENVKNILVRVGCGVAGCFTMSAVMILVATVVRKTIATIGVGIGLVYALLWLETTFRNNMLPFVKYTYSYQIRQIEFAGEEFAPGLFLIVMIITSSVALTVAAVAFERIELK